MLKLYAINATVSATIAVHNTPKNVDQNSMSFGLSVMEKRGQKQFERYVVLKYTAYIIIIIRFKNKLR